MWYDYLPINENQDFMTHGYIFDVFNNDFINAKDFAKIHHLSNTVGKIYNQYRRR